VRPGRPDRPDQDLLDLKAPRDRSEQPERSAPPVLWAPPALVLQARSVPQDRQVVQWARRALSGRQEQPELPALPEVLLALPAPSARRDRRALQGPLVRPGRPESLELVLDLHFLETVRTGLSHSMDRQPRWGAPKSVVLYTLSQGTFITLVAAP